MIDENFGNLGALYRKVGMSPQADLISSRVDSAKKIYENVDNGVLVPLLRGAFGIAKQTELKFIEDVLVADDPDYSTNGDGPEAQLVATALLRRALEEGGDFSAEFALGVVVTSFGGIRSTIDDELLAFANKVLAEHRTSIKGPPVKITNKAKPNLAAELDGMKPYVESGQFREAFPGLRKLVEGNATYAHSVGSHLVTQLQALADNQRRLTEQMEVHWWVLGAWSIEQDTPFSEVSPVEAGVRAGMDLARLSTASSYGLFASPALIDQVLGRAVASRVTSLKEVAVSGPREWRAAWSQGLLQKPELMSLLPVSAGVCLALDSDEQPDWEPRYMRHMQIDASSALSVRDASVQMYLEQLLLRALSS